MWSGWWKEDWQGRQKQSEKICPNFVIDGSDYIRFHKRGGDSVTSRVMDPAPFSQLNDHIISIYYDSHVQNFQYYVLQYITKGNVFNDDSEMDTA